MTTISNESAPTMTRFNCIVHALIALLAVLPSRSSAQQGPLPPIRVTLVASASVSRGGRTEVVRRAQLTPQNVVFVDQNATPEDLAGALAMLKALRIQHGDHLQSDFRARPEVIRQRATWAQSAYRAWLIEQLIRLRKAAPASLGNLGVVSAVKITLPAGSGTVSGPIGARP